MTSSNSVNLSFVSIFIVLFHPVCLADQTKITEIEAVTVTVRHWQELQYTIPENVIVLDQESLSDDLSDLDVHVPNVKIEESSVQTRVAIRGITGLNTGLFDPVGYFFDGVALPLGGTQLPKLFNLQQTEIIKGPQGTLYGRNSEAGVIKINTRDADWKPTASLGLKSGVHDGADANAPSHIATFRASNALIEEKLAAAIALRLEDTQGPYFNTFNNDDEAGDDKSVTLSAHLQFNPDSATEIGLRSLVEDNDMGKSRLRFNTGNFVTDRFTTNHNSETFDDKEISIHSLTIDHDFNHVNLVSITGLTQFRRDFQADLDAATLPAPETLMDLDDDTISQEFRLSSTANERFKWLLGTYFYDQSTQIDFRIGGPPVNRDTEIDQRGIAAFAQTEFALSDKFKLGLGARAERIEQEGSQRVTSIAFDNSYARDIKETELLPKLSLSYEINENARVFVSVADGYLPGGYNYSAAINQQTFIYDKETSRNIEIGTKMSLFDNKLDLQAAAFLIKTKDKQIVDIEPGNVRRISNAAEVENSGIELSANYRLGDKLSLFANIGLQNAEAKEFKINATVNGSFVELDLSGNSLPLAPERTYAAGVRYGAGKGVFSSFTLNGSSDYFFDSANTLKQDGYTKVDAKLGYHFKNASVALVAKNIADEEIFSRAVNTPNGIVVEDSSPRYVGLQFDAHW